MRGPDFVIPDDLPGPGAEPSATEIPRPVGPRRAMAVVALVVTLAVGAFARSALTDTTPRPPAVATSAPARGTAATGPVGSSSASTVARPGQTSRPVRICADAPGNTGAPTTPSFESVTLDISPRVTREALALFSGAVAEARQAFGEAGAFTMHVHCDVDEYAAALNLPVEEAQLAISTGRVAHVRRADMWLYGPAVARRPLSEQRQTIHHEYFHMVQGFLSSYRSGRTDVNAPLWLVEGSAEYFEHAVAPGDLQSMRRTQIRRHAALPALEQLEDTGGGGSTGGSGEAYTVGLVASDYLVTNYGRERLQHDYWVALAMTDWRSAFGQVFGVTVDEFYSDFEAYRATLRP